MAHVAVRRSWPSGSQPRPSAKASASSFINAEHRPVPRDFGVAMRPEKSDFVFPVGQFKGLTFWNVLHESNQFPQMGKRRMTQRVHTIGMDTMG